MGWSGERNLDEEEVENRDRNEEWNESPEGVESGSETGLNGRRPEL